MGRRRLLWQIYPSYLLITVAAIAAAVWYTHGALGDFYREQTFDNLQARAVLFRQCIRVAAGRIREDGLQELVRRLGAATKTRITVVHPGGEVAADSDEMPDRMQNHGDRKEIRDALAGGIGMIIKVSPTLRKRMMYVAIPVHQGNERSGPVVGVVRTALPMTALQGALRTMAFRMVMAGGGIILAAAGLSYVVSRRISRPLVELKHAAERFARGDLKQRVTVPKPATDEIGSLAEAMNTMAGQLDEWIRTIVRERNEKSAVLSSMIEGVFAVDQDERIIHMNRAAGRFMDADPEKAVHRLIHEIVRNPDLLRF
ncbi:MAG: HAMP domain-containing protein, partial [Planctomycetota bacterium]